MILTEKIMRNFILVVLSFLVFFITNSQAVQIVEAGSKISENIGPRTEQIDLTKFSKVLYVSVSEENLQLDGSKENPFDSINDAIAVLNNLSNSNQAAILVSAGIYSSETIEMKEYVHLYGGYNPQNWERDIVKNETVISGKDGMRIIAASNNTTIDGFTITGAKYRGKGAAVYCDGTSPIITNNKFTNNITLKPLNWNPKFWHEQANDGGAIACENNSSPMISNNIFYKNFTENGRGGAIALNNKCGGKIINNVFIENVTGLYDTMRSSDGGAVSIFNWCNPLIENNVFIGNKSLANNDAGALFVALWSSPKIIKNIFVGNKSGDDAGALFVGGQEHRYDRPLDSLPPKDKFFVEIDGNLFVGNQNPSQNSGVMRFTMESRGSFTNNICFNNTGLYFQRCEVQIYNNTIIENFLLIETKEGLGKNYVSNNIIWGNINVDAPSEFSFNDIKEYYPGEENFNCDPSFKNDEIKINPISVSFDNTRYLTNLFVSGLNLTPNSLKGRIVYADGVWGVVESNNKNNIELWGDFTGKLDFLVLQTLSLASDSPCVDRGKKLETVKYDYYGVKRPGNGKYDIGAIESK